MYLVYENKLNLKLIDFSACFLSFTRKNTSQFQALIRHLFIWHFFTEIMNDGDWKVVHKLEFTKTQRGRNMLVYGGYRYVTNQNSTKNIFWRCSHYVKFGCRASVVTSKDLSMLRYAGAPHSHQPESKWAAVDLIRFKSIQLLYYSY